MTSKRHTTANLTKIAQLKEALDSLLEQTLQHGFHGHARVEVAIADGTIQSISRSMEQVDKSGGKIAKSN